LKLGDGLVDACDVFKDHAGVAAAFAF
jgi:hypothetical protein